MTTWKKTLIAGCAVGTLVALGVVTTATSGHRYNGSTVPSSDQRADQSAKAHTKYVNHPVYGHMFKHPVYGYKFKHPVYGYIPVSTAGHGLDDQSLSTTEKEVGTADPQ